MALDANYATVPNHSSVLIAGTETNLQVPTGAAANLLFTAGANNTSGFTGSKVEEVDIVSTATTLVASVVAGLVYLWIYNGTNYRLRWTFTIPVSSPAVSATVPPLFIPQVFLNLTLKTGEFLYVSQSIAGNAGLLVAHCHGADF